MASISGVYWFKIEITILLLKVKLGADFLMNCKWMHGKSERKYKMLFEV